jgi:hypothetical protein
MKKFFTSWSPWVMLIIVGALVWTISVVLPSPQPRETLYYGFDKSLRDTPQQYALSPYAEVKFWVEFVGRCMLGVGGIASTIKIIVELFHIKLSRKTKGSPDGPHAL